MNKVKVVAVRFADGWVAHPLAGDAAIVAQGATADEALNNLKSAIAFHAETFGIDAVADMRGVVEAIFADITLPVGSKENER